MSDDARRPSLFNPAPLIAIALLAAGLIARNVPLESARPQETDRKRGGPAVAQDVDARLWQDPFAAVEAELARLAREAGINTGADGRPPRMADKRAKLAAADPVHQIDRLRASVFEATGRIRPPLLLAFMVPGGNYAEDAEARRRARYSAMAALATQNFVPLDADHLGYVWLPADGKHALPEIVPYEWFYRCHGTGGSSDCERALLLWIDDSPFGERPLASFSRLARLIACLPGATDMEALCALDFQGQPALRIIGPTSSGGFAAMLDEANSHRGRGPPAEYVPMIVYSPYATNPESTLPEVPETWRGKLSIWRTIAGDDLLVNALVDELRLRDALPLAPDTAPTDGKRTRDAVLLFVEQDTLYARQLEELFRERIAEHCPKRCEVVTAHYFRGLDGITIDGSVPPEIRRGSDRSGRPAPADELFSGALPRERAHGRSQYDYLRRAAADVHRGVGKDGRRLEIRSVGIFGSDVYDKLIVLQALRESLPRSVFFTTDLDARMLEPDQSNWVRNLVVASNWGLRLNPGLQRGVPPFRDNYQTSGYLAALLALATEDENGQPVTPEARRRLAQQVARWTADPGSGSNGEARWRPHFGGRKLFEIGHTRAVELDANGADRVCASAWDCINPQPLRERNYPRPGSWPTVLMVLALTAVIVLASCRPAQMWFRGVRAKPVRLAGWAGAVLAAVVLLALGYRRIRGDIIDGVGEPFLFLQGVSMWPVELLRVLSITLIVIFLFWIRGTLVRLFRDVRDAKSFGLEVGGVFGGPHWWSLTNPLEPFPTAEQIASTTPHGRQGVAALWAEFHDRLRFARALPWVIGVTIVLAAIGLLIGAVYGTGFLPHRGVFVRNAHHALSVTNAVLAAFLVVTIVYVIRTSREFIVRLVEIKSQWPEATLQQFAERMPVSADYLDEWIDFQLVVKLTKAVNRFVYFPFVILTIAVGLQSKLLDALDFPWTLMTMIGVCIAYTLYSAIILRRAAESARGIAIGRYENKILDLRGAEAAPDSDLRRQLVALIDRIKAVREGSFTPFTQQPVVRAFLIPAGGFGGISIAEYLSLVSL